MLGQIITEQQGLFDILKQTRTIATIGARDQGPAHDIPQYLADHGYTVIPISPKLTEAFGQKAYASPHDEPTGLALAQPPNERSS